MKCFRILLAVVVMTSVNASQAQNLGTVGSQGYGIPVPNAGSGQVCGPCIAGHVHHASTVAESYGRGIAARGQAQAYYNLLTSQAMRNAAETERLEIENKQKRAEAYHARREAYKNRVAAEFAARRHATQSIAGKDHAQPEARVASAVGIEVQITWPVALEQPRFAGYRKLVKQTVAERVAGNELTIAQRSRLSQANHAVLAVLSKADGEASVAERDAARHFVENLATGSIPETVRLAAN